MDALVTGSSWHLVKSQKGSIDVVLQATPSAAAPGTMLTWTLHGADHCRASGAFNGDINGSGSNSLDASRIPANEVTVACQHSADMSNATARIAVAP
jgi:hypothetical protein